MKSVLFFTTLLVGLCYACDSEPSTPEVCQKGIVLNQISCSSASGVAFSIKVELQNETDTIVTTTLPDAYQVVGTQIFFRVRAPQYALYCTTNITPPQKEYDVYDISTNACTNE